MYGLLTSHGQVICLRRLCCRLCCRFYCYLNLIKHETLSLVIWILQTGMSIFTHENVEVGEKNYIEKNLCFFIHILCFRSFISYRLNQNCVCCINDVMLWLNSLNSNSKFFFFGAKMKSTHHSLSRENVILNVKKINVKIFKVLLRTANDWHEVWNVDVEICIFIHVPKAVTRDGWIINKALFLCSIIFGMHSVKKCVSLNLNIKMYKKSSIESNSWEWICTDEKKKPATLGASAHGFNSVAQIEDIVHFKEEEKKNYLWKNAKATHNKQ